ncbi:MAG: hypothetical protein QF473_26280, partial [Planctomycetota bacterium]|nr:hypothetical protein [Planctomycetota bacterium]
MRCITFLLPTKHNLALTLCVLLTFMFAHKLSSAVKELLIPLYAPRFHLQELYNDYAMATALDATHDEKYRAGLAYLIARLVASVPIAYGLSCFVCALLIRFPPSKDVRCSRLSLKA